MEKANRWIEELEKRLDTSPTTKFDESFSVDAEESRQEKRGKKKKRPIPPAPRPKQRRSVGNPFAFLAGGLDAWKKIGVSVVLVAAIAGLGFSAYQFYSGPEVRVLRNID